MFKKTTVLVLMTVFVSLCLGAAPPNEIKFYYGFGADAPIVKYAVQLPMCNQNAGVIRLGMKLSKSWSTNLAFGLSGKYSENSLGVPCLASLLTATFEDTAAGKPYLATTSVEVTFNVRKPNKWEGEIKFIPNLSWKDKTVPFGDRLYASDYVFLTYTVLGSDTTGGLALGLQQDSKINKDGACGYLSLRLRRIFNQRFGCNATFGKLIHNTSSKEVAPYCGWFEANWKF